MFRCVSPTFVKMWLNINIPVQDKVKKNIKVKVWGLNLKIWSGNLLVPPIPPSSLVFSPPPVLLLSPAPSLLLIFPLFSLLLPSLLLPFLLLPSLLLPSLLLCRVMSIKSFIDFVALFVILEINYRSTIILLDLKPQGFYKWLAPALPFNNCKVFLFFLGHGFGHGPGDVAPWKLQSSALCRGYKEESKPRENERYFLNLKRKCPRHKVYFLQVAKKCSN